MSTPTAPASFSRAALLLLLACGLGLFALSVLLRAYDDNPVRSGSRARPGAYSVSAIGHAGLYDMLRRLDLPILRGTGSILGTVGARGTLIVAEPDLAQIGGEESLKLLNAPRLLLVLPKWRGTEDKNRPAWVSALDPLPLSFARGTLNLVDGQGDVYRDNWPTIWKYNELSGIAPTGSGTVQLVRSQKMRPIIGTADGILLGELTDAHNVIWVLSDPDILSNHGLFQGENAALMLRLINTLRMRDNDDPGAPVVFDETVHGVRLAEESPVKLLFRFPFVLVTLLTALSAALLAWSAVGRFGVPQKAAPVLDFGKAGLIRNGARLLDYAGHHGILLKRYARMNVRCAARALHAPPGLSEPDLADWLDRIGKARGLTRSCKDILHTVDNLNTTDTASLARLFDGARDIHLWKGELLNGTSAHRRDTAQYPD